MLSPKERFQKVISGLRWFPALILDSLFPIRCTGCRKADTWLCSECYHKIPRLTPSALLFDKRDSPDQKLDGLIAATLFRTPIVARLIHLYKYAFVEDLKIPLGRLLAESLLRTSLPLPHFITFVPLHPRRLRQRGWNQSELLAQELCASLNAPVPLFSTSTLLRRTRFTKPQIQTRSREERLRNLTGAFQTAAGIPLLKGQIVWIVDDVATTYATLEECAKVLKAAGAKEVYGLVVAR